MDFTVRAAKPDDFDDMMQMLLVAFHDNTDDQELINTDRLVWEVDRSLVAQADDGQIVAHVGAFTRHLTVPGGAVPAAFVTMVGVAGTHRRRRIASQMLIQQLTDARALGDTVAVLWASEGRIYQRFGYGMASRRLTFDIENLEVRLNVAPAAGSVVRSARAADLRDKMIPVYEAEVAVRPGYASRSEAWWDFLLSDPAARRGGAGPLRALVHEGQSGPDGYVLYRVRQDWDHSGPKAQVEVRHVVANNPVAYRELWRHLLDMDLTRKVSLGFGGVDEPLMDLVNEPRRLNARIGDGLWLRVLDVPAALSARRYGAPVDLVLEVHDELIPENSGRFRLTGLTGGAHCVPSGDPADLTLDIGTLGSLYLGGNSAGALADAGRITEHTPGAIDNAHAAFGWRRAPAGIEMF